MIFLIIITAICVPSLLVLPFLISYITVRQESKVVPLSAGMALIWGIAGFCFKNPATDPDLVRYLSMLRNYFGKSLFESFNLQYENLFAVDIYFHFISKLGNPQFLPAISVFIFYFIILYILADYKRRTELSNGIFSVYVLFVLAAINFPAVVNGIRWPIACVMIFLAVYRELVQNKRDGWTIFFYIIPVFMHFSMLAFLALRLALLIKNKKVIIAMGASVALLPQIFNILSTRYEKTALGVIGTQLRYFIARADMYFQWKQTDVGWADTVRKSIYYRVESWFYYVIVAYFCIIIYLVIKQERKKGWEKDNVFVLYLTALTIISFTMAAHTYIRFVTPLIASFCCVSFKLFNKYEKGGLFMLISKSVLVGFALIGIVLNIHLLGTMVALDDYFVNIFTSGALSYLFQCF